MNCVYEPRGRRPGRNSDASSFRGEASSRVVSPDMPRAGNACATTVLTREGRGNISRVLMAGMLSVVVAGSTAAQGGDWRGTYGCAQWLTAVNLTVRQRFGSSVDAVFHFYAVPQNPGVPTGCFWMQGRLGANTQEFSLTSDNSQWIVGPGNYVVVNFHGCLSGRRPVSLIASTSSVSAGAFPAGIEHLSCCLTSWRDSKAGDLKGSTAGVWHRPDVAPEAAPLVVLGSEGQHEVLAASLE
jgi:hypothetical protein